MSQRIKVYSYSIYHSANSYIGIALAEKSLRGLPIDVELHLSTYRTSRELGQYSLFSGSYTLHKNKEFKNCCNRTLIIELLLVLHAVVGKSGQLFAHTQQ